MKYVWIVFGNFEYDEESVESVWSTEELAIKQRDKVNAGGGHPHTIAKWLVDDGEWWFTRNHGDAG